MGLNLTKMERGTRLNLSKEQPALRRVRLGLSWDVKEGVTADLDASVLCLTGEEGSEKLVGTLDTNTGVKSGCVWYGSAEKLDGKPTYANGAIIHNGDNRTGEGEGDDEEIIINLDKIPDEVTHILSVITIYNEDGAEKVNFGRVKNASVRVYNDETGEALYEFDLTEDASNGTAVEMTRLYKKGGDWRLATLGEVVGETQNGLEAILVKYQ
jgi:tellurium resistance protein TerD